MRARQGPGKALRPGSKLSHVLLAEVLEIGVLENLRSSWAVVSVVGEHLEDDVLSVGAYVVDQFGNADELLMGKFQFHVRCDFLEFVKQLLGRRAQDVMNFVDLVELVFARKQRKQRQHFEEHTPSAPDVHFVSVVPVGHQALGGAVPARADVFGQGWFVVEAAAASQVCELHRFTRQENVLPNS